MRTRFLNKPHLFLGALTVSLLLSITFCGQAGAEDLQLARMQAIEEDLNRVEEGLFQRQQTRVEQENRQIESNEPAKTQDGEKKIFPLKLDGYYKNLFIQSKTFTTEENYFADNQRLRLNAKADLSDKLQAVVNYDVDLSINDFANTPDFEGIRSISQENLAFWDAEHVFTDTDHVFGKHSLYRAYLQYYDPNLQLTIGKQKVDWGRTRFWSPADLFNPVNPLSIEYEERMGVDAINIERPLSESSSANLVYAQGNDMDNSSGGLKISKTVGNSDLFALAGEFKEEEVIGAGFDGQVGSAGIRGEGTFTNALDERQYFRGAVGAEYTFPNTLSFLGEYFYNGGADKDFLSYINSFDRVNRTLTRNKHLLGLLASYEFTPLLKTKHLLIYDVEDKSTFYNPEFSYNLKTDLDLSLGSQMFWGKRASEFGSYKNVYYAQSQLFF